MNLNLKYIKTLIILCLMLFGLSSMAQEMLVQTVKGRVIDQDSNSPIIGANVIIAGSDPVMGGSTGIDGEFRINNVPIGRVELVVTSIGYEQRVLPEIVVGSAKEVVLTVSLEESLVNLEEIVITDRTNKSDVANEMVLVSGRAFSVEETNRYAGTLNDPARAVTNFAGISGNAEGSNHIIVRGNSPNTVQWRMEGVEIPNPNHFALEGSAGGNINILNAKMLANSDFYMGAFTADYGNVMGGVFDMKMRTGNRDEREYSFGLGILGTDITLEGPFIKGGRSSYLANYRYATLGLLDNFGLVDFGGVPKYQDLSFKLSFPTKNKGLFTLFGLGGVSSIRDELLAEESDEVLSNDRFSSHMGTLNLSHVYFLNENSSFETFLAIAGNGNGYKNNLFNENLSEFDLDYKENLNKYTVSTGTTFLSKLNAKNTIKTGMNYYHYTFDFNQQYRNNQGFMETWLDEEGDTGMFRGFATWKHRFNEALTLTTGLNYQHFILNGSQSVEPRISIKYKIDDAQSIFGGVGLHSQMASLPVYFALVKDEQENWNRPNQELGLMKARHYVFGYDRMITENLYFKSEIYYQDLYDIPVENSATSSYSIVNATDGLTDRALVNEGTGSNYGIELTLERYFDKNYYFLITGSLFESKYMALDGVERDSRFNSNYVVNAVFGKEFKLGNTNNKVLSFNTKFSLAGARRYTAIDLESSIENGKSVRFESRAFEERGDDVFKLDMSLGYSWNRTKTRQEIKLDVQNISNRDALVDQYFNTTTSKIENSNQLTLLPTLMYTLEF